MIEMREMSEALPERTCMACGARAPVAILAFGAAGGQQALCRSCICRPGNLRELVGMFRAVPTSGATPRAAGIDAVCRDAVALPDSPDGVWEEMACALADPKAQIEALARQGWECTLMTTPHHGSLTLTGYFRHRIARLDATEWCGESHLGR